MVVKHYKLAAAQGHINSQFDLGVMYYHGEGGVSKDLDLSIKHYKMVRVCVCVCVYLCVCKTFSYFCLQFCAESSHERIIFN